jgi:hypothetical protein
MTLTILTTFKTFTIHALGRWMVLLLLSQKVSWQTKSDVGDAHPPPHIIVPSTILIHRLVNTQASSCYRRGCRVDDPRRSPLRLSRPRRIWTLRRKSTATRTDSSFGDRYKAPFLLRDWATISLLRLVYYALRKRQKASRRCDNTRHTLLSLVVRQYEPIKHPNPAQTSHALLYPHPVSYLMQVLPHS